MIGCSVMRGQIFTMIISFFLASCNATHKVKVEEINKQNVSIKKEIPPLSLKKVIIKKKDTLYTMTYDEIHKMYKNIKAIKTNYQWLVNTYNNDVETLENMINKKSFNDEANDK